MLHVCCGTPLTLIMMGLRTLGRARQLQLILPTPVLQLSSNVNKNEK